MKALVVYYSRTGNTKKVGEKIASMLSADVEEIVDVQDRSGILGYIMAGKDASLSKKTVLKKAVKDASKYDILVVGTPVWAWNVSPPVRTYLEDNKDKLKNVAFYCTQGGSGSEKAFKSMEQASGKKPVATLELTEKELADSSLNEKVKNFTAELKKL